MKKWKSFGGSIDNFKAHSKEVYIKEIVGSCANEKIIEELEKMKLVIESYTYDRIKELKI